MCGVRLATVQGTYVGYGSLINRFEHLGEYIKSLFTFIAPASSDSASPIGDGVVDAGAETVGPLLCRRSLRGLWLLLVLWALLVPWRVLAGTWTALTHTAPSDIGTMLLLSDGTVLAQQSGISSGWYRLTPDTNGSYVTGTWSTLASMHSTRLYYSSQVLTNGRVFVAGAEYGTGWDTAEVYDPVSNTWTQVPVPPGLLDTNNVVQSNGQNTAGFIDMISETLANGDVLMAPVEPATCGETVLYSPASNTCSQGPSVLNACNQDEASWVKLPDNSILTIDPFGTETERYIPSLNEWVEDATVSVYLWSTNYELGAAFLLPTGQAFFLGGNGHTALYTPTGTTSPGHLDDGPQHSQWAGNQRCAGSHDNRWQCPVRRWLRLDIQRTDVLL